MVIALCCFSQFYSYVIISEQLSCDIDLLCVYRPPYSAGLQQLLDNMGYEIVMTEVELNGPERFAADGVLTEKQCNALITLANVSFQTHSLTVPFLHCI